MPALARCRRVPNGEIFQQEGRRRNHRRNRIGPYVKSRGEVARGGEGRGKKKKKRSLHRPEGAFFPARFETRIRRGGKGGVGYELVDVFSEVYPMRGGLLKKGERESPPAAACPSRGSMNRFCWPIPEWRGGGRGEKRRGHAQTFITMEEPGPFSSEGKKRPLFPLRPPYYISHTDREGEKRGRKRTQQDPHVSSLALKNGVGLKY